ncbi:hypothetical protein JCM8097_005966 [Rhodosporidiobolus ruineniae]
MSSLSSSVRSDDSGHGQSLPPSPTSSRFRLAPNASSHALEQAAAHVCSHLSPLRPEAVLTGTPQQLDHLECQRGWLLPHRRLSRLSTTSLLVANPSNRHQLASTKFVGYAVHIPPDPSKPLPRQNISELYYPDAAWVRPRRAEEPGPLIIPFALLETHDSEKREDARDKRRIYMSGKGPAIRSVTSLFLTGSGTETEIQVEFYANSNPITPLHTTTLSAEQELAAPTCCFTDAQPDEQIVLLSQHDCATLSMWTDDSAFSAPNVIAPESAEGNVFSASFCPDDPTTLAIAGSKANLQIWDTATNPGVRSTFGDRLCALGKDLSKTGTGVVGLVDDDEED